MRYSNEVHKMHNEILETHKILEVYDTTYMVDDIKDTPGDGNP
jgi:hypothetical protein